MDGVPLLHTIVWILATNTNAWQEDCQWSCVVVLLQSHANVRCYNPIQNRTRSRNLIFKLNRLVGSICTLVVLFTTICYVVVFCCFISCSYESNISKLFVPEDGFAHLKHHTTWIHVFIAGEARLDSLLYFFSDIFCCHRSSSLGMWIVLYGLCYVSMQVLLSKKWSLLTLANVVWMECVPRVNTAQETNNVLQHHQQTVTDLAGAQRLVRNRSKRL
jgi:hypothetical protein